MDHSGIENPIVNLLLMLLALGFNALFVAAEFALISIRQTQIKKMIEDGTAFSSSIDKIKRRQDRSIAGAQLGITLASLAIGWLGEGSIHQLLLKLIEGLPASVQALLPAATAIGLSFIVMSILHVVVGEQVPKIVALRIPIRIMQILALPFRAFCVLTAPLIWLMDGMTTVILFLFGLKKSGGHESVAIDPQEYPHLFEESEEAGNLKHNDRLLLQSALQWGEITVAQAMRPRNRVDFVSHDISLAGIIAIAAGTKHSKLPVYEGTSDKIVGVFYTRDLFALIGTENFNILEHCREPHFAPESMDASVLFQDMRASRYQIAIVTDEYGGTAGIVTQEDLLERLVGDIEDEHDPDEKPLIRDEGENVLVIRGETLLVTVNQHLGIDIKSETGQTTIAGAVIEILDHQPEAGESVNLGGYNFTVLAISDQAVEELRVSPVKEESSADAGDSQH